MRRKLFTLWAQGTPALSVFPQQCPLASFSAFTVTELTKEKTEAEPKVDPGVDRFGVTLARLCDSLSSPTRPYLRSYFLNHYVTPRGYNWDYWYLIPTHLLGSSENESPHSEPQTFMSNLRLKMAVKRKETRCDWGLEEWRNNWGSHLVMETARRVRHERGSDVETRYCVRLMRTDTSRVPDWPLQ